MPYDSTDDPYLDPSSGVLRNVLDIANEELLEWAEANITSVVIAALAEQPVIGLFNLEHLQDIHYELFHTIYDWAGEIRTSEIGKEGTRFANSYVLQQAANGLFDELRKKDLLRGLDRQRYIEELAHYYSEINILHPFREGNGRAQRATIPSQQVKIISDIITIDTRVYYGYVSSDNYYNP
jgi:cell filamentation protein